MKADKAVEAALEEMVSIMRGARSETTRIQAAQAVVGYASRVLGQEDLERLADGVTEALGDILGEGSRK